MANAKINYSDQLKRIDEAKERIEKNLRFVAEMEQVIVQNPMTSGPLRLELADKLLNICAWYLSAAKMGRMINMPKADAFIEDGRQLMIKAVSFVGAVVSFDLDRVSSASYSPMLEAITEFSAHARFNLAQKMQLCLEQYRLTLAGDYRFFAFYLDMQAKMAAAAKNLIDFRSIIADLNFGSPIREPLFKHVQLIKAWIRKIADDYRYNYEANSHSMADFRISLLYLEALQKISFYLNENAEIAAIQKKLDAWNDKYDSDMRDKK